MFEAFVLLLVLVPPILGVVLVRTRWWWIPGTALLAGAMLPMCFWDNSVGHDAVDALSGIGNFVLLVMTGGLVLYGVVVLGLTHAAHRRPRKTAPPPPELPVARVV